ncbi:MAG: FAD binding domain-containing protein [Anaerolineae bacterium]
MAIKVGQILVNHTLVALSIEEALARLATWRGTAQLIANGTSLAPRIASGELVDRVFINVSRILVMRRITDDDGVLHIGGAVTFAQLAVHPLVLLKAPLLSLIANRMVTLGHGSASLAGDTVSAWPTALGALALVAMHTEARVVNLTGSQWLPVASLFHPSGICRIDSTRELIASYRIPSLDHTESVGLVISPDDQNGLACALRLLPTRDHKTQQVWALKTAFAAPMILSPGYLPAPTTDENDLKLAQAVAEAMLSHLKEFRLPAGKQYPSLVELASMAQTALNQAQTRLPFIPAALG